MWLDLIDFSPPFEGVGEYRLRPFRTGSMAAGANLDEFTVRVRRMPTIDGQTAGPAALARHVRLALTSPDRVVAQDLAEFRVLDDPAIDKAWHSDDPLGVTVIVTLKSTRPILQRYGLKDDAPLVVSDVGSAHWTFSTAQHHGTPATGSSVVRDALRKSAQLLAREGSHPVAGARQFGVRALPDGSWQVFTRAADFITDIGWVISSALVQNVFETGDLVWTSFQERVAVLVRQHGGDAEIEEPERHRLALSEVLGEFPA